VILRLEDDFVILKELLEDFVTLTLELDLVTERLLDELDDFVWLTLLELLV